MVEPCWLCSTCVIQISASQSAGVNCESIRSFFFLFSRPVESSPLAEASDLLNTTITSSALFKIPTHRGSLHHSLILSYLITKLKAASSPAKHPSFSRSSISSHLLSTWRQTTLQMAGIQLRVLTVITATENTSLVAAFPDPWARSSR